MTSGNRIAIVGAGIAGLASAKVLSREGFPIEVFDRTPDVGGVWSATRRYPGLRTQNSKRTYRFSDLPMPDDYPDVPDGAQMQAYLEGYVDHFGLRDSLRLGTEVVAADPVDSGWLLEIRDHTGVHRASCDHLVVANGVYSDPFVPDFRGADLYQVGGGQLLHTSNFHDLEAVRGRTVLVVGYGKSACDVAEAVSHVAASTRVVARRLLWKMPRKPGLKQDYERLILTRAGEAHFRYQRLGRAEKLLHGAGRSFRDTNFDVLRELATKKLMLRELDLVPEGRFEEIAQSSASLATEGFYEQVRDGRIVVHRDTTVVDMLSTKAGPAVDLSDGQRVQADVVLCATGFQQRVPFLTPYVQRRLTDENGNFRLYRHILPVEVPNLSFAGYNSSFLSPLGAEVGAHWTAALLRGGIVLPPQEELAAAVDERLSWMDSGTDGHHAHGTVVTPFAIHNIDDMLRDLKFRLPLRTRLGQWLRPVKPSSYRGLGARSQPATQAQAVRPQAERLEPHRSGADLS
ncbi:flavin-containing monooxygenase [Nocardia bovistercoris]|uniref:NAD(P)/FAD-dependent oxidoreductase n=1 Tax=Nocardia bovistercoris TaxID=2785916 RepID=A0A931N227_9NOCA|nr:NAD(P)/FAD-dependent oxidoreductase [Nocardia bovistercoris]MBH0775073.1 NAD(P)/FAD-dependent oxidoreductase [Nocardia bovistercoris]